METVSTWKACGGTQGVYRHASSATGTDMTFAVYVPPHEKGAKLPVLWYLSGLTCTHANVMEKGEYRAACAEKGIIFVAPDTSPRGEGVPDKDQYDLGTGASFYVDATEAPWSKHYRMRTYIEEELPELLAEIFPVDMRRQSIMGHSMGGHGALTVGLRNTARYRSISAFSPIVSPLACPWGQAALSLYLGENEANWRDYDACMLIADGARHEHLRVDQGSADEFLEEQLKTGVLRDVCKELGQPLELNLHAGYDHSYYFISTFMADHVHWHADRLGA
ncbi:S-formylglutathione hydrolase [Pacificimonas flava]|uniref:S-formylglutathione hydrolase n=2 Tax=Pacificimonas TaxID=1960290 RepID=A0A219B785_9SPHN|nr:MULTISPECIES: S-formylglutathione hydrolase [Pacificimonas]MBZ6378686.1 S-formylglutathione hydrolase [Pacificimonas aurantium]OWV34044.1 S-formylglutathione hydrolase [Pacificimonas flava]